MAKHPTSPRRVAWRIARTLLLAYVVFLVLAMIFESKFIYMPMRYPNGEWAALEQMRQVNMMGVEEVTLTADDGVRLHGLYCTPPNDENEPRPVVLWFHGNAGNVTHRLDTLLWMTAQGLDVFIIDYRGYGKSQGSPGEAGLYADARAAWRELTEHRRIDPHRIVVFGRSLGGAVAIELCHALQAGGEVGPGGPAGLIVESSFTSVPDMARHVLPVVPRWGVRTQMNNLEKIRTLTLPKLVVHSRADEMIPFAMGERLYEAAAEPKRSYWIDSAGHNETDAVGGRGYIGKMIEFVRSATTSPGPTAVEP